MTSSSGRMHTFFLAKIFFFVAWKAGMANSIISHSRVLFHMPGRFLEAGMFRHVTLNMSDPVPLLFYLQPRLAGKDTPGVRQGTATQNYLHTPLLSSSPTSLAVSFWLDLPLGLPLLASLPLHLPWPPHFSPKCLPLASYWLIFCSVDLLPAWLVVMAVLLTCFEGRVCTCQLL